MGLVASSSAYAADAVSPVTPEMVEAEAGGWTFAVSADFGDILDNLEFGAMVLGEARNDRYSIFGDIIYAKLSSDAATSRGVFAERVDVTSETFAGLLGAGYSVLKDERSYLDVVAGVRVWDVRTEISLTGGILDGRSASDGETWVDGLVGVRGRYNINENFYLTGWGLVGAGDADVDWDVAAAIGYRFNDTFSALVGYRALGVDCDKDGFVFDVVQQGPIMGLVVHF
ncbi:MAG: DUF481 domain-containing protein [Pseudaminobacter sp.]